MKQKILVIEDEASIRINISLMLKAEGFDVRVAENGRVGVEAAAEFLPELVLCDVMMPELDGFGVLDALRADKRFADVPFVFLTALDDRASMRRGMNLGADDYLTKPFTRDDLIEAVGSRLKRQADIENVFEGRLTLKVDELQQQYAGKLAGESAPEIVEDVDPRAMTGRMINATVLFSDIRNFTTYSERLTAADTALLLNTYFERACQPILAQGGRITKLLGDGVMVLFEPTDADPNHARRALRAALGMAVVAHRFRDWVHEKHGGTLPEFSVGSGLHTGEVIMCRVGAPGSQEWTVIGDSVNVASRLEGQTKELGWVVVASRATVEAAGAGVSQGADAKLSLRGRSEPIEVVEVIGMGQDGQATGGNFVLPQSVRDALRANATNTAEAAKGALNEALHLITSQISGAPAKPMSIAGYRIVEKIGEGGMSSVFLVRRESDNAEVVLKIVSAADNKEMIDRFMREAQILSSIDHPNVVKIFDQGFGKEYAYIAMEYFTGGTLSELIRSGLSPRQTMSLLAQAAGALREIHRRGIIHRDIKPANMMVRADGTIALVDFGVARQTDAKNLEMTQHGIIFGTPYYLSPEQANGVSAVEASDIYSLGIIFYEMLTQKRPYVEENMMDILNSHINAPVPRLPDELAGYQELLDHMMAKKLSERFADAEQVLDAIDALWTKIAIATSRMTSR